MTISYPMPIISIYDTLLQIRIKIYMSSYNIRITYHYVSYYRNMILKYIDNHNLDDIDQ